jgi:hypothetical protein
VRMKRRLIARKFCAVGIGSAYAHVAENRPPRWPRSTYRDNRHNPDFSVRAWHFVSNSRPACALSPVERSAVDSRSPARFVSGEDECVGTLEFDLHERQWPITSCSTPVGRW